MVGSKPTSKAEMHGCMEKYRYQMGMVKLNSSSPCTARVKLICRTNRSNGSSWRHPKKRKTTAELSRLVLKLSKILNSLCHVLVPQSCSSAAETCLVNWRPVRETRQRTWTEISLPVAISSENLFRKQLQRIDSLTSAEYLTKWPLTLLPGKRVHSLSVELLNAFVCICPGSRDLGENRITLKGIPAHGLTFGKSQRKPQSFLIVAAAVLRRGLSKLFQNQSLSSFALCGAQWSSYFYPKWRRATVA